MKRLKKLLLFTLLVFFISPSFSDSKCRAQTVRCYYAVASYNKEGVKSALNRYPMYLAFINNNNVIYQCDKNGNSKSWGGVTLKYQYIGRRDGKLIYKQFGNNPYGGIIWTENYLYFTPNFQRLNNRYAVPGFEYTYVYEMGDPEDEVKAPDIFY